MSILSRITAAETWPEMEAAARRRFWEGFILATSLENGETGAIYLFGYVIEILLKTAYYKVDGVSREQDTRQTRNQAGIIASVYGVRGNDHDLTRWLFLLERVRLARGNPFDSAFLGSVRYHVATVAVNWKETLRYRDIQPTDEELAQVYNSVEWVLRNSQALWS